MRFSHPAFFLLVFTSLFATTGCDEKNPASENNRVSLPVSPISTSADRSLGLDKSPMDMIYYPVDYPIAKMSSKSESQPVARVIYSRPRKDGRKVFGEIVQFGTPWRLGANEATEIEFFQPVQIQNKNVGKGRYVLYSIPSERFWQLRLNTNLNTWGLNIDSSFDAYSFDVPVYSSSKSLEVFSMEFAPTTDSTRLTIGWDTVRVSLPITFD